MSNDATQNLVDEARKAQRAVYLATDKEVADDLSRIIGGLADALEAAQRPPVSPEQKEALDELIADVLIAERDEWPRDPGDAPSEVLAGAVTDALLARFSLPELDTDNLRAEK